MHCVAHADDEMMDAGNDEDGPLHLRYRCASACPSASARVVGCCSTGSPQQAALGTSSAVDPTHQRFHTIHASGLNPNPVLKFGLGSKACLTPIGRCLRRLRLLHSEEVDPARALAMLERETANLGPDCIDVLRKLLEQELHEQVSRRPCHYF